MSFYHPPAGRSPAQAPYFPPPPPPPTTTTHGQPQPSPMADAPPPPIPPRPEGFESRPNYVLPRHEQEQAFWASYNPQQPPTLPPRSHSAQPPQTASGYYPPPPPPQPQYAPQPYQSTYEHQTPTPQAQPQPGAPPGYQPPPPPPGTPPPPPPQSNATASLGQPSYAQTGSSSMPNYRPDPPSRPHSSLGPTTYTGQQQQGYGATWDYTPYTPASPQQPPFPAPSESPAMSSSQYTPYTPANSTHTSHRRTPQHPQSPASTQYPPPPPKVDPDPPRPSAIETDIAGLAQMMGSLGTDNTVPDASASSYTTEPLHSNEVPAYLLQKPNYYSDVNTKQQHQKTTPEAPPSMSASRDEVESSQHEHEEPPVPAYLLAKPNYYSDVEASRLQQKNQPTPSSNYTAPSVESDHGSDEEANTQLPPSHHRTHPSVPQPQASTSHNHDSAHTSKSENDLVPRRVKLQRDWSKRYSMHGIKTVPVCLDTPMDIQVTWYSHPDAPESSICSRCYVDWIYPTQFRHEFKPELNTTKKLIRCRFSKLRVEQDLFPRAVATGNLHPLLDYMRTRPNILDCRGTDGAKGEAGIIWWKAKDDAIPGLVVCDACMEDVVKARGGTFADKFEPAPGQAGEDVWSCDMAVNYVATRFDETVAHNDWASFARDAHTRLYLPACPKLESLPCNGRAYYSPVQGPKTMCICEGCYYDRVLSFPGQESGWYCSIKKDNRDPTLRASCDMAEPNVMFPMILADELEKPQIFFDALRKVTAEPNCHQDGHTSSNWYTLQSSPRGFAICGSCYYGLIETWGLTRHFKRGVGAGLTPNEPLVCSFNQNHVRFGLMMRLFLETWFSDDSTEWADAAERFSAVKPCTRANDFKGRAWYGWAECTICPECYESFVRGTVLDDPRHMPLRNTVRSSWTMCEMYSPRMRKLYLDACSRNPPDASDLRQFSDQRRLAYCNTLLKCREMVNEQKMALQRQTMLNQQSLFYTQLGRTEALNLGVTHTYGAPGVGYGFANKNEFDGAVYGQQARDVGREITNPTRMFTITQLEREWNLNWA